MAILDSVFGEATKWLLEKVDEKLKGKSSRDRAVLTKLYDCLCNIAEYSRKCRDDIDRLLIFACFRNESLKGLTKYDWAEGYSYRHNPLYGWARVPTKYQRVWYSLNSEIRHALNIFNEIGRTITLESEPDKEFWDDLIQYLKALQTRLDETYAPDYGMREFVRKIMAARNLKKHLDNIDVVDSGIEELSKYINMKWPP